MGLSRYANRRDANEPQIIQALEAAGATVQQLNASGVPDLLVGYTDPATGVPMNILIEVKDGRNKLTADQEEWIGAWAGQVFVVYSIEQALEAIGR